MAGAAIGSIGCSSRQVARSRSRLSPSAAGTITESIIFDFEDGLLSASCIDLIENIFIGTLNPLDRIESGNPSVGSVDVFPTVGEKDVGFMWGFESECCSTPPLVAYIDNITLHPVPESSTLLLLGLPALMVARRRAEQSGPDRAMNR